MYKKDVIAHFGQIRKIAALLGINRSAVYQWPEIIPERDAFKIERITGGKLKHNSEMYEKKRNDKLVDSVVEKFGENSRPIVQAIYKYIWDR